tara:strand:- start:145 stop:522 length:378 start_codon:yes stop_codon:yes gene_type:complete
MPDTGNLSVIPMDRFRTDTRVSPMTSRGFQHITFHKTPCRQRLLPVLAAWSCAGFLASKAPQKIQTSLIRIEATTGPLPSHRTMPCLKGDIGTHSPIKNRAHTRRCAAPALPRLPIHGIDDPYPV